MSGPTGTTRRHPGGRRAGSATAGLRFAAYSQPRRRHVRVGTDAPEEIDLRGGWLEVPVRQPRSIAFRRQWKLFLRHVVLDEAFPWNLRIRSWRAVGGARPPVGFGATLGRCPELPR